MGSAREARWLVEHVDGDAGRALDLAGRRAAGEPLQYVMGRWPFRSLELSVDPRVLIPRPETEQVVEVALAELARLGEDGDTAARSSTGGWSPVCLDLGTGSGAIALSLAARVNFSFHPNGWEPGFVPFVPTFGPELAAQYGF